jgi:hypothetical protein
MDVWESGRNWWMRGRVEETGGCMGEWKKLVDAQENDRTGECIGELKLLTTRKFFVHRCETPLIWVIFRVSFV